MAGCKPSRARWDWSEKDETGAESATFHWHFRVGQDDGRGHFRRRQSPRGGAFGDGKIGAGDAIYCRRTSPWGTGSYGDLRRTPERIHVAGRQFWFKFKNAAEKGKTRNSLPSSARPFGG